MEDLLGRYLSDAEKILTAQGECFEVIETAPPNNPGNRRPRYRWVFTRHPSGI